MRKVVLALLLGGTTTLLGTPSCGRSVPSLLSIDPPEGYPRQMLSVTGGHRGTTLIWDVDLESEHEIVAQAPDSRYFQIPRTAGPGTHRVAIRDASGTSNALDVTVLERPEGFPTPRIEDVGVFEVASENVEANTADVLLTVSAANLDIDAEMIINGKPVPTVFWSGLPIDHMQSERPGAYAYPIYHYGQLLGVLEDVPWGTTFEVSVRNDDDGPFDTRPYTLPSSAVLLDSDGDGITDVAEKRGFRPPGGGGVIDIAAMGCTHLRKDILVEADWIRAAKPDNSIWATIQAVFANAPVLNPDGSRGIDVIIDRGQGGAFQDGGDELADHAIIDFELTLPGVKNYVSFYTYKNASFDRDRLRIFHYCVFGRARPGNHSGRGEIWGNDFIVSFSDWKEWSSPLAQVGTFVHELGHNLGLRHGGIDNGAPDMDEVYKPNMASTMNYRWQFGGVSNDCDWSSEGFHTFSSGVYRVIDERKVYEKQGICGSFALDMNEDGKISNGVGINTNVDGDNDKTDRHVDYNQWGNLLLDFDAAGSRWGSN